MKAILVVIGLVWFHDTVGQPGFQPGYLLPTPKDTLRGLVRFSSKTTVPAPCFFKRGSKDPIQQFIPGQLSGFRLEDGSYFVPRSIGKSSDVFLEVLVKGYVSLYKFGDMYFIEKGDSAFFELSDEFELVVVEGERVKKKSRNYTRMLVLLLSDCDVATQQIPDVPLKEKQLVSLVVVYNRCKGLGGELFRVKPRR